MVSVNELTRMEINLELEVLKQQRPKAPSEQRRKADLIKWLGDVKALIDHVENQQPCTAHAMK